MTAAMNPLPDWATVGSTVPVPQVHPVHNPHGRQRTEMMSREEYIIDKLYSSGGQSRFVRNMAVMRLIDEGYPEDEISTALDHEIKRLVAEGARIRGSAAPVQDQ